MTVHRVRGRLSDPEFAFRLVVPPLIWVVRLLYRLRVVGAEHVPRSGPVLLASNHVSFADPVVLMTALFRMGLRPRFLALDTFFRVPLFGWALKTARQIPVRRGGGIEPVLARASAELEDGHSVLIYPEGTIPPSDSQLRAKPGAGLIALRTGVPVVPVAVWGMQRGVPAWRWFVPRRPAALVFGEPVDLTTWQGRTDRVAGLAASQALLTAIRERLGVARDLVEGQRVLP